MIRSLPRRELAFDIVAALILWAITCYGSLYPVPAIVSDQTDQLNPPAIVVSVILAGALAIRRLSPVLALSIAWVAVIVQMSFGLPPLAVNVAIFGVLYAVAAYGTKPERRYGLISVFAGSLVIMLYLLVGPILTGDANYRNDVQVVILVAGTTLAAAAFGLGLSYSLGALKRARIEARETSKQQEIAEALAVAEQERVRIARDMHDVVAHSLAVVVAQADGARYAAATQPEVATEALTTISQTARSALSDVRLLLTQLRHSQAEGPQPTLADLEELYAQVRAAGLDLRVDVDPTPRANPPGAVQLAVYRILQEALTNAIRYSDGSTVSVTLGWHPERVDLEVRNVASATEPNRSGGHGIIGMRERASLVGGTLEAAPDGENFVVRAVIPLPETAAEETV